MKHFLLFLLALILQACISPFTPKLADLPPKLVVDGLLTDQSGPHKLRLAFSAPFDNSDAIFNRDVVEATVYLTDDKSTRIDYLPTGRGNFQTPDAVRGIAGRSYVLHINLADGRQYESKPELLRTSPPIDTVYTEFEAFTGRFERGQFRVFLDLNDPATTGDYYRWKWTHYDAVDYCVKKTEIPGRGRIEFPCCEPCWNITTCNGCLLLGSDALINGRKLSRQEIAIMPYDTIAPYYLRVEQQRMTKAAYDFWKRAKEQTANTGGLFDLPPATVMGNVVSKTNPDEQVLGFFGASGQAFRVVYLRRDTAPAPPTRPRENLFIPLPECYACNSDLFRTPVRPPNWR